MTICAQCGGVGSTIGTEPTDDLSDNEIVFQTPHGSPGAIPCSQCGGRGFQTYGNGA